MPENYKELIYDGGFLDHMGAAGHPYNPEQPLNTYPNNSLIEKDLVTGVRDIDVDAFEIINPSDLDHHDRILAVRKDWISFLRQGLRMTGTANSDSHHSGEQVAVPRNMVAVAGDSVSSFDLNEFVAALKSGNSYGTTGPMLEVSLSGVAMGQTLKGVSGILQLKVAAADWVAVETIKIQVNGETIDEFAANGKTEFKLELDFTRDSFVTVEVSGPATATYSVIYPRLTPYAFTNPIYVDFNSDGKWDPI